MAQVARSVTNRHRDEHDALRERLADNCRTDLLEIAELTGQNATDFRIAAVPYNDKPLAPLPELRRESLVAHLVEVARDGFAGPVPPDANAHSERQATEPAESKATDAACATCLGDCCKAGGPTWGFITVAEAHRFRSRAPDQTPEDFVAHYLSHVPTESVEDNCVFQGSNGCTLEREDRANLCNAFLCRGLRRLSADADADKGASIAIIAQSEGRAQSIGLFDPARGERVHLRRIGGTD